MNVVPYKGISMKQLTTRQRQVLTLIESAFKKEGRLPSLQQIAQVLKVKSKSGVLRHIEALKKKGFLQSKIPDPSAFALAAPQKSVAFLEAFSEKMSLFRVPLAAVVSAGTPRAAYDQADSFLELSSSYFGRGEQVAVKISGNSMDGDSISDGDIAIINRQQLAEKSAIVAVRVGAEEVTLKRLRQKDHIIELVPSNPTFPVRSVPADQVEIIGKMVGLIRKY